LLELTHHGNGPVQINIPVPEHTDKFDTAELPKERKINRIELANVDWKHYSSLLEGKKVLIVCGEGYAITELQKNALEKFCKNYDVAVLCDKMSNCHVSNSIENAFPVLQALNTADISELAPDIIISIRSNFSFNPEFKGFVKRAQKNECKMENWFVHPSGKICDPYKGILFNVFEMDEFYFFEQMANAKDNIPSDPDYAESWKIISNAIEEPSVDYGHINAVGKFLKKIPNNCVLQLANSNSVRMAQLYHIDPSIEIHCNRGTDGIDGCMSTTVGYASETEKLTYLMIGDLTFFYDMNALWNRQLGKNVRIFLDNNGGGAIMHMPKRPDFAAEHLPNFISARHNASAKAWAEDRGFNYIAAHTEEEVEEGVNRLTDINADGPILLEVFSEMLEDTKIFKEYYASISRQKIDNSLIGVSKRVVLKVCKTLGIDYNKFKLAF